MWILFSISRSPETAGKATLGLSECVRVGGASILNGLLFILKANKAELLFNFCNGHNDFKIAVPRTQALFYDQDSSHIYCRRNPTVLVL